MEVTDISFRAICLGQNPPLYDSRPPFLGLFAFRPEDREFFFGRDAVSYTHLRAHETVLDLVCRLLLEKKNKHVIDNVI